MSLPSGWYRSPILRSLVSGILLGAAFPPSPVPSIAFVALLPWLTVFDHERSFGRMFRSCYAMLFAFHLTTVYWTGGFVHGRDEWMMAAGGALLVLHPFFYLPFIMAAWGVRRQLGRVWGLAAFVLFWVTFEFFHARGEFSFPWIALGNSQASDILRIQMAELVSTTGLSLHILAFNALSFAALQLTAERPWPAGRRAILPLVSLMALVYAGPMVYGWYRIAGLESGSSGQRPVHVTVVQPDIDPWEKWGRSSGEKWLVYERQLEVLDSLTRSRAVDEPDLIIWPETATPFHVLLPGYRPWLDGIQRLVSNVGGVLVTGLPHARYFDKADAPITSRRIGDTDRFVESYNSVTTIASDGTLGPIYGKVVLVPFAERLPHAEALRFLIEPLMWNVGISSWGQGTDTTVFRTKTRDGREIAFSAMVCYESVYPEYVRAFVERGARILVVVTNDSWWGNTSGAYQHAAYASLRAVEFRRWVVQGANGGISLAVSPAGHAMRRSSLYERTAWTVPVFQHDEMTFYARHGDLAGMASVLGAAALGGLALLDRFRRRKTS
ncbi:MAG: apolipoprotein N-acyltransferase [Bacteroidetes bacterium]|jgi:apolipoprotein N-acyltransferase|nr:apolipoprotein N-acyltransferase [Bacteroidota bacterium]